MPRIITFLLFLVPYVVAQRNEDFDPKDPNWFTNTDKNEDATCCECVPYYECKDGKIDVKAQPNFDLKQSQKNVQKCGSVVEFCCLLPNLPKTCSSFHPGPMPKLNREPQPGKTCECAHWETCPPEKVVTDGKGRPSEKGLLSHSKCVGLYEVCCSDSANNVHEEHNDHVEVRLNKPEDCVCVPKEQCIDGVVNTSGVGLIEPRGKTCPIPGEVCCIHKSGVSGSRKANFLAIAGLCISAASYIVL